MTLLSGIDKVGLWRRPKKPGEDLKKKLHSAFSDY